MVCTECRTPNFRDYRYCRECGTRLEVTDAAPDEQAEVVEQLLQHAFVQMEQGDLEKAVGSVQAALARDPENPSAHSALGLVYERQGQVQDAIHQFRVVLQLSPDSTADRDKLQQLLDRGGRDDEQAPLFSPVRLAIASAVAAGVVTFGVGLSLANGSTAKASARDRSTAGLVPASVRPLTSGPSRPRTPVAAPATSAPLTPLQQATQQQHTPVRTFNSPAPVAVLPTTRAEQYRPTPPAPWQPSRVSSNGLQPAQIGEVIPLTSPDLPNTGGPSGASAAAGPQSRPQPKPRVEPLEPDTGFIKIEPIEKPVTPQPAAAPGTNPAAPANNPRPSISISISPGSR